MTGPAGSVFGGVAGGCAREMGFDFVELLDSLRSEVLGAAGGRVEVEEAASCETSV